MTEKQASQIMEKTVIDGIPHPNILEYMEALNISIDILGTDYTRDQLKMPDGWRKAFGEMMCEEIKQELVRCDYLDEYMIIQIKEKYASLRWYDNGTPIGCKVLEIIDKYSVLSENICMICGKPDVPITGDVWFYPLCEKCYCTSNDYRKGDMTEEELKEFWNERKKDWEVWNNEDYKMRDKYTIHRWSKDKDDAEEIIYDISETANKIRSKYYNGNV